MRSSFPHTLRAKQPDQTAALLFVFSALLAGLPPCSPASAAIKVWDGSSSGLWSVGANWSGSTPPQNGDELHFPHGVSRRTITNDISNLQVTFVWFMDGDATNYVLRGNALTVGGASGPATGGIQSNQTNGVNTIDCDVIMKRSDLGLAQNFFFIFPGTGTLILSGDIALAQDPLAVRSDPGSLLRLSGAVSGTNGITLSGAGTVRLDGSSANTYTGVTSVQHGVLQLNKSAAGTGRVSIPGNLILSSSGIARLLFDDQIADTSNVDVFTALDLNGHSVTVGSLRIDGGVVTNGGVLDLFGDVTVPVSGQIVADVVLGEPFPITFAVTNPAANLQIDGGIMGPGGLNKTGAGTLTFLGTNANTYSGGTTVRGGVLALNKPFGLAIQGPSLVIGDSSDGNSTDTVRFLDDNQLSGVDVTINRTGLLDLNGFTGIMPGDLTLIGGKVQMSGGFLHLFNDVTAIAASQGLTTFSSQISGNLFLESGIHTFTINNGGFLFGATIDLLIDATISGSGAITKNGNGDLELDALNTYSGATIVNDGILFVGNNAALGSASGGTTVNDPGRVTLLGGISVASEALTLNSSASNPGALFGGGTSNFWGGNISFSRTTRIGVETNSVLNLGGILQGPSGLEKEDDGELIFSGSTSNRYGGLTFVKAGTLFLNKLGVDFAIPGDLTIGDGIGGTNADVVFYSFDQIDDSSHVTINNSGALSVGSDTIGPVSGSGNLQILNTGSLITVVNNTSTTLGGIISGGGNLTKRGNAAFTLNANNTYTGDTTVETGTLVVNGSQPGSDVTVLSGATLGGSGRVGALHVATGANVAPGTSPGRLTASSSVLSNDSVLHIELKGPTAGTSYDQLRVFGSTTITGSKLAPSLGFAPFEGQVFTILDNNGTDPITGAFDSLANGAVTNVNGIQMRINYSGLTGNDVTLTVTNLPARSSTATVLTGNGDGHIDPNECNQLFLRITNSTGVPLTNVQGALSSTTPGVIITRAGSAYPDMKTLGAAGTNLTAFQFFTDTNFLCGPSIEFLLTLSASNQAPFAIRYVLQSGTLTASQTFTNNSGVGIPSSGAVVSPIVISGLTGSVAKVTVSMSLFHQNLAELEVFLIPPAGPTIPLAVGLPGTQLGTNCTNGRLIFDDDAPQPIEAGASPYIGTFRPDAPLNIADGESGPALNGVWLLQIIDFVPNSSVGALSCWSLTITPATCTAGGGICSTCIGPFFGAITALDPTMPNTIPSSGPASVCGLGKACPGDLPVTSHFDAFTFTNESGPICVNVTLDSPCLSISSNPIGCAAYVESFDPAKPCRNYLGDIGDFRATPASFSFNMPSNGNFIVIVDGATNLDCPSYILRVDGLDCPPRLGANSVAGGAISINWPNHANGFKLESTTNLISPNWLPVTNQPRSFGGNFIVTNNLIAPHGFYRLHKP
jgi:autotransporter-associated beta strand protein